ncbi:hypothetical protein MHBO_000334 [Bonamia ostreae]|uniref:Squalene cyclase N-terminal domain-containing protein n=1 Tax=Bonamia ostreae TaxID=126728 RepID=A0ABV2AF97_9EUKA
MFLLPNFIIVFNITRTPIETRKKELMTQYIKNHQNEDGGWGTHIQSENSTMFGSVMNYIAARLLGNSQKSNWLQRAKRFIHKNGGAIQAPPWAKFWMSVLGVYEWVGINSILPELWVLPECLPFHPSRWWCHCRMVYLPMAYIYANKIKRKETATTKAIKDEIFTTPYNKVNWIQNRSSVSELDDFYKLLTQNFYIKVKQSSTQDMLYDNQFL